MSSNPRDYIEFTLKTDFSDLSLDVPISIEGIMREEGLSTAYKTPEFDPWVVYPIIQQILSFLPVKEHVEKAEKNLHKNKWATPYTLKGMGIQHSTPANKEIASFVQSFSRQLSELQVVKEECTHNYIVATKMIKFLNMLEKSAVSVFRKAGRETPTVNAKTDCVDLIHFYIDTLKDLQKTITKYLDNVVSARINNLYKLESSVRLLVNQNKLDHTGNTKETSASNTEAPTEIQEKEEDIYEGFSIIQN